MLRAAVVALMTVLLTQPVIHSVTIERAKPLVIVLRDVSPSMTCQRSSRCRRNFVCALPWNSGLLDNKFRDTTAQQAADALTTAQRSADTAVAGIKLALQLMQESAANAAGARERIIASCDSLVAAGTDLAHAAQSVKEASLRSAIDAQSAAALKLKEALVEIAVERPEGQSQLAEKSQAVAALSPEIAKALTEAQRLQDSADRTLAAGSDPTLKSALGETRDDGSRGDLRHYDR